MSLISRLVASARALKSYAFSHRLISLIVLVVVLGGGYWEYGRLTSTSGKTLYVLGTVSRGTIISTISGSGQISPSNQVDVKPKVAGDVTSVPVKAGQYVKAGTAIAYIDASDAQTALRNAQTDLETAQLNLDKIKEPPDTLTLMQAEDKVSQAQVSRKNAADNLDKAYSDGYNDVVSAFLDLPDVMAGLKNIIIGTSASRGAQWNIDYYRSAISSWDNNAYLLRDKAYDSYVDALNEYNAVLPVYQATSPESATSTVEDIISRSANLSKKVSVALANTSSFIQVYEDEVKAHNQTPSTVADSAQASLSSYVNKVSSHSSQLVSDANSISSYEQSIADADRSIIENQESLKNVQDGADALDIRSAEITVQLRRDALADAQNTLADYTVRAPFDGTLAKLDVVKGDSVSSGTSLATMITDKQIAELSVNEIDAAKIKVGQRATLTFDAIDDLTLAGEVISVDTIGTVSQGVVSYTVEIGFDSQDDRVKPGMTVNATIQTDVRQNVLVVPSSAVKTSSNRAYILSFNPALTGSGTQGVASKTPPSEIDVTTGISDDTNTEISSGVTEGQQIVVRTTTSGATSKTTTTSSSRGSSFGGPGGGIRL